MLYFEKNAKQEDYSMAAKVVEFKTDHRGSEALEAFKREVIDAYWEKLILVLFHDPECGPSRNFLQRGEFMPSVVEGVDNNVVICKINLLKGENGAIADQYEIRAYPTIVFIQKGRLLRRVIGAEKAPKIMKVLNECLQGRY